MQLVRGLCGDEVLEGGEWKAGPMTVFVLFLKCYCIFFLLILKIK